MTTTESKRKPRALVMPEARERDTFVARLVMECMQQADRIDNGDAPPSHHIARVASYLCRQAKMHNGAAVALCNGWLDQEAYDKRTGHIEARILRALAELGPAWGAHFGGDPRGATVKLRVPSGYSDDWGGEGLCVPT